MLKRTYQNIVQVAASDKFFYFVVVIFVIQAAWLAASAAFPMIYDEHYHAGIIDIYSKQWSPFIGSQTLEQVAHFSDVTRLPSYLFHYLLSFPYRVVASITDSFYIKIVSLRLINVLLVVAGMFMFKKLLARLALPGHLVNIGFLLLVLLPIMPFVAAHINYDNLLFLVMPLLIILGINILDDKKLGFKNTTLFLSVGLLSCLIKFTFLPIFSVAFLYIVYTLYKRGKSPKKLYAELQDSFLRLSKPLRVLLCILFFVSAGLFTERYVFNVAQYKDFSPTCKQVHAEDSCLRNGLVRRNERAREAYRANPTKLQNIVDWTRNIWLPNMMTNTFFTGAGVGEAESLERPPVQLDLKPPIEILNSFAWLLLTASIVFLAYSWRFTRKMPYFWLLFFMFLVYLFAAMVLTNYKGYRSNGQVFAIQPRYFLVFMPFIITYSLQAANLAIRNRAAKVTALVMVLVIFTQGGGILTYIYRSSPAWYWQRRTIIDTNMKIKKVITPAIRD